jgi:large subunit ribosomal protein L19
MIGQAFLSGQTGQALFKSKEGVFALNARKQSTNACLKQDIDFFFDSETEIDTLENVKIEQVFGKLKNQKRCFDALNATIAGFDPILSLTTRKIAIQQAESLLEDSDTYNFVQNRLFGNRVPSEADLPQALIISQNIGFHKTLYLYQCLAESGDVINDLQFLFEDMVLKSKEKNDLVSIRNSYIENGIFSAFFNSINSKTNLVKENNTIILLDEFKIIVFKKYDFDSIDNSLSNFVEAENVAPCADLPEFSIGDIINVYVKIRKGSNEHIQVFRGTVIQRRNIGADETFTLRKISNGISVERIFPLHSPNIDKIEVLYRSRSRRARLFYLRGKQGKGAKVKVLIFKKTLFELPVNNPPLPYSKENLPSLVKVLI